MKTEDYINSLIAENEGLKAACKSHVETILMIRKELGRLKSTISKKDRKLSQLESTTSNLDLQNELNVAKNELAQLKKKYDELQSMYNRVTEENAEYKSIFNEIENICENEQ
jgi:chromosome segregation ATPase